MSVLPSAEDSPSPRTPRARYEAVRAFTESLCETLETEDYVLQSMPEASPVRWHLAHTTWFFESFVLAPSVPGYSSPHPMYGYLFNSYYTSVGERWERAARGMLSRPTVREVFAYRRHVDDAMAQLFDTADESLWNKLAPVVETGIHHEQQHQELLVTDLKHALSFNPLGPIFRARPEEAPVPPEAPRMIEFPGGVYSVGHEGDGFAYDHEGPNHRVFLEPFAIADRAVTCGEFMQFIDDGGYETPLLWLDDGWTARCAGGWRAPLYWSRRDEQWQTFTLAGPLPVNPSEPLCHVSYYEADAFARWASRRLPTEFEWEVAARHHPVEGNFADSGRLHPEVTRPAEPDPGGASPRGLYGDTWEWTASHYSAYPGYRAPEGAIGEYNGKFMCNQFVLRGGSCATSQSHLRRTYRNFFYPNARWQFAGVRLAGNGATS